MVILTVSSLNLASGPLLNINKINSLLTQFKGDSLLSLRELNFSDKSEVGLVISLTFKVQISKFQ